MTSPARIFVIFAVAAIAGLAGCGKSANKHAGSKAGNIQNNLASEVADPAITDIENDVSAPVLFAIAARSANGAGGMNDPMGNGPDDGPFASMLDNNGRLDNDLGGAVLTGGSYTVQQAQQRGDFYPPIYRYQFMPDGTWMAARVLQVVETQAFVKRGDGQKYEATNQLLARGSWFQSNQYQRRWYLIDLGHFKVTDIQRVNEFQGPDTHTGAITKIRSYKVVATFEPNATLTAIAPAAAAGFGSFTWTVAVEQNPITMGWEFYKAGTPSWTR